MSDNPKHQHPIQVIGNVPVRSIGPGEINPKDPVQIVGKDRDGVFWAVPYGAAAKGFDWSRGADPDELKPCPLCCGEPKPFGPDFVGGDLYGVNCTDCGCEISGLETPEAARAAWNNRPSVAVVDASDQLTDAIAERDAARKEARRWESIARFCGYVDDDQLDALSAAHSPTDGGNVVSAGDDGDGILRPSTAAYSAAVRVPRLGERYSTAGIADLQAAGPRWASWDDAEEAPDGEEKAALAKGGGK